MRVSIQQAIEILQRGGVVALPTETVYGLAASLDHPQAVAQLFALKKRPANNPLIIHCALQAQVQPFLIEPPLHFDALAQAFWPGPLTLVMPVNCSRVPERVRAGLPTAAFRIPQHPLVQRLIQETGPLVMPSANLSGRPSATCAEHVEHDFGPDFPVVDGGACDNGVESTILYWNGRAWELARLGALPAAKFHSILGELSKQDAKDTPICPGQLLRHYAPQAKLVLLKECAAARGVVIGFSDRCYPEASLVLPLSASSDPHNAARRLYKVLRELDEQGIACASVDIDVPDQGLWLTLKERLLKASAKEKDIRLLA